MSDPNPYLVDYAIPTTLIGGFCGLFGSVDPNSSLHMGHTIDDPEHILTQGLGWLAQTPTHKMSY